MSAGTLSPYYLGKARELYNFFNVFNALSWSFLAGNIVTLFAMKLNASAAYIGLINALLYMSLFFLPVGKLLTKRFSIIKIFSAAWIVRAIGMLPLIFIPFFVSLGRIDTAKNLLLLGVSLFHIFRGVGMVGNNPILSNLATGPDRGSYMTQIQIINSAVGMFCGFFIALVLGRDPPIYLYALIIMIGIVCGVFSGILMRKIPEPPASEDEKHAKLSDVVKEAFINDSLRRFLIIFFMLALVSGVSRTFIVVYSQRVFMQTDGMISLYSVFGGLGILIIGLLIKFLVDRIGAKPIFIICTIIGLVGMLPIIFIPARFENFSTTLFFLASLFFILNFGLLGAEGLAQVYFLGLVPKSMMLDMSIIYFFVLGIAGASGSFLSGLFLDLLAGFNVSSFISFKVLYSILTIIAFVVLFFQRKLVSLGAMSVQGAMEVIFSLRDLRAITLLDKLNKTKDSEEEMALLGALYDTPSKLAVKGLLNRAKSPRLAIRMEAMTAMEALDTLDDNAEKALIEDIIHNPYTTAYISARILGNQNVFSAVPVLRELVLSDDYMLAGEAIIALAKLKDEAFRSQIEEIILKTHNPRLKIMGVEAFGIYQSPNSLSVLLDILRVPNPPPYLRDEIVLAMANILNTQHQFYSILIRFLEDEKLAHILAIDEAVSASETHNNSNGFFKRKKKSLTLINSQAKTLVSAVRAFMEGGNGVLLSRWILELPDDLVHPISQMVLAEAILDDDLIIYERFKLLVSHWAAHTLRVWSRNLK